MLFEEIQKIFREVFENPEMVVSEEMSANDIADWASIVHMQLLATIEEKYGIKFSSRDIRKMKKVRDLVESVDSKIHKGGDLCGD